MTFSPVLMPRCWGFDTDTKLTATSAARLKAAPFPGQPISFIIRCVSLGAPSVADITIEERDAILSSWPALGLYQHVEYPSWIASPQNGRAHGIAAVAHAALVEYPAGCHLGLDMEGLGNAGAPVFQYVSASAEPTHASGYKVLMYDGYDDGLSLDLKKRLKGEGVVDDFWSDFGPRSLPPGLVWAIKQHAQQTVAGIAVDADEVLAPEVIAFMGVTPDLNVETSDRAA